MARLLSLPLILVVLLPVSSRLIADDSITPLTLGIDPAPKRDGDKIGDDPGHALGLDPQSADSYISCAVHDQETGDYDKAIYDCGQAIQIDPKSVKAYLVRGSSYNLNKLYASAIQDFSQAILLNPKLALAYLCRGSAYVRQGDYDKAFSDFNEAIQLDPNYLSAYVQRSEAYMAQGQYYKSITDSSQVIYLDPNNAVAHADRGVAYGAAGQYDKSIGELTHAIQLNPNYPIAYYYRGSVYEEMGDKGIAVTNNSHGDQLDLKENKNINNLQIVDYGNAIADYEATIALSQQRFKLSQLGPILSRVYFKRGQAYFQNHEDAEAIADYSQAIQINPNYAQSYFNRAVVYDKDGEYEKAIADFGSAIQSNPANCAPAYNGRAWILATCPQDSLRDGQKAVADATEACEETAWKNPFTLGTLAAAYAEIGHFDDAVKWQNKQLESSLLSASDIAGARKRLALYEAHQPYRDNK